MLSHIKHLFFDLDHTLWDFDKNANESLNELFFSYKFDDLFGHKTSDLFIDTYSKINHSLWEDYHHGKIDKSTLRELRFSRTFESLGVDPKLFPLSFEEDYLSLCPTKTNLLPFARETLEYLKGKYPLHLITNGFKEAVAVKLKTSKLQPYFQSVVISEELGVNKPDPKIFQYALDCARAAKQESVMIGDNPDADIAGASSYGMDTVYFNCKQSAPCRSATLEISSLKELTQLL